jgi:hypothetical protein
MTELNSTRTSPRRSARRGRLVGLAALAVPAALVLGGCGDDADDTATDPGSSSSTSSSPSATPTETGPASPSTTGSTDATADPVPELPQVVVDAVKPALQSGFPALIPSGLPDGWTVEDAQFQADHELWTMTLTDDTGATVTLVQVDRPLSELAKQYAGTAKAGEKVDLGPLGSWDTFSGSDEAIGTTLPTTSVVVYGSDQAHLEALGQTLAAAEDSDIPDAG